MKHTFETIAKSMLDNGEEVHHLFAMNLTLAVAWDKTVWLCTKAEFLSDSRLIMRIL